MKRVFLFALISSVLASCASNEIANSKDVNQDKIYQKYTVKYDESSNETHIKATYRFGGKNGTTLVLTPPSTVTFNDEGMTRYESDFVGAYYKHALSKPLANGKECKFIFTDTKGKQYTNAVNFNSVLIGGLPAEIKKGNPLTFTMVTNPLAYGEKIVFTIKDTTHKAEFVVEEQTPKKQFLIPATVLKKLNGEVHIQARRSYNIMLKEATEEGGTISFEYETKWQKFIIN